MPDFSMPKVTKGLRPNIDERKSSWVVVPHRQQLYLLPVIKRQRKIVPVFGPDGQVTIQTEEPDPELSTLVDRFVMSTAMAQGNLSFTVEAFEDFIRLARALFLANYEMSDEEIVALLSMTEREMSVFYSALFIHCQGN